MDPPVGIEAQGSCAIPTAGTNSADLPGYPRCFGHGPVTAHFRPGDGHHTRTSRSMALGSGRRAVGLQFGGRPVGRRSHAQPGQCARLLRHQCHLHAGAHVAAVDHACGQHRPGASLAGGVAGLGSDAQSSAAHQRDVCSLRHRTGAAFERHGCQAHHLGGIPDHVAGADDRAA